MTGNHCAQYIVKVLNQNFAHEENQIEIQLSVPALILVARLYQQRIILLWKGLYVMYVPHTTCDDYNLILAKNA